MISKLNLISINTKRPTVRTHTIMCSPETFNSVLFSGFGTSRFIFHPLIALLIVETERSRLEHVRRPRGLAEEEDGIVDGVLASGSDTQ
jgi:hypothetical protein